MSILLNKLRLPGIPVSVSMYAVILSVIGIGLGISALLNPTSAVNYVEGADAIAGAWAGRTLGLGLAMAAAVWMRSNTALTVTFIGAFFRELGDIVGMIPTGQSTTVSVLAVFLVFDAIAVFLCIRSLTKPKHVNENT